MECKLRESDENFSDESTSLRLKSVERENNEQVTFSVTETLKNISYVLFPTFFFSVCIGLYEIISMSFIGYKLPPEEAKRALDAIGTSSTYVDCFLFAFVFECMSSFETFGSNAYGLKQFDLIDTYFQRGILITSLSLIFVIPFHFFTAPIILSYVIQDELTAKYIYDYIRVFIFYVPFEMIFSFIFRYLNIFQVMSATFIILISTLCVHPLWCYIFIYMFDLGVKGAGYAVIFTTFLNASSAIIYILMSDNYKNLFTFNKKSFLEWWPYIKYSLSSVMLICSVFWMVPILMWVCLWVSFTDFTIFVMICKLNVIANNLYFAFETTATLLIGKEVTSIRNEVKKVISTIYLFGLCFSLTICFVFLIFRQKLIYIFLDNKNLSDLAHNTVIIAGIFTLFDFTSYVMVGIVRGIRLQLIGTIVNFISQYGITLGLSILTGKYLNYGVNGVFLAMLAGSLVSSITYFFVISNIDWEKTSQDIIKEIESEELINNY